MNKLTKIGVSALCGSLASIASANAGTLGVTGGVDITWMSFDDETTGNPLGMGSNLTFTGSGELDNGWSVALSTAHTDAAGYSNTNVVIGVPGLGDFRVDHGDGGTGLDRMDDMTPAVWEEAYGTGLGTGIDTVSGVSGGVNIEFTPSGLPDGLTGRLAWSPNVTHSDTGDKGSGASAAGALGSGWDVTLSASSDMIGVEGLTVFGGISEIDQFTNATAISGNKKEQTFGATYAVGGFTLGYQWSEEDTGRASTLQKYTNDAWGVTFSVNDDLSIGYNHYESAQDTTTDVTAEASSIQVAYTMGGATITIAEGSADNMKYSTDAANDRDATTIKLALAF